MIINEMYGKVKAEKKQSEELKTHLKPKKDQVKREKPVPNVTKVGLFSVDNWISKIEGTDPEILKNKITKDKKLNIEKVSAVVDRLIKPSIKNKARKDPNQQELKQILGKYNDFEKQKEVARKKVGYRNKLPDSRASIQEYSQTSTMADNDIDQVSINDNSDYSKYLLSNVHKEEAKLEKNKKQMNEMLKQNTKLRDSNTFSNSTPIRSERISASNYEENNEEFSENQNENVNFDEQEELSTFQINKGIVENLQFMKDRKEQIVDVDNDNEEENEEAVLLSTSSKRPIRKDSKDSINERVSLNKDLQIDDYSDEGDRDIDLEEQYNKMQHKEINEKEENKSDNDSINDVDVRYF